MGNSMKISDLSASQTLMAIIGIIMFVIGTGLLITWLLLHVWNWFVVAAGWSAEIPINFATVFGVWAFYTLLKTIFGRSKS